MTRICCALQHDEFTAAVEYLLLDRLAVCSHVTPAARSAGVFKHCGKTSVAAGVHGYPCGVPFGRSPLVAARFGHERTIDRDARSHRDPNKSGGSDPRRPALTGTGSTARHQCLTKTPEGMCRKPSRRNQPPPKTTQGRIDVTNFATSTRPFRAKSRCHFGDRLEPRDEELGRSRYRGTAVTDVPWRFPMNERFCERYEDASGKTRLVDQRVIAQIDDVLGGESGIDDGALFVRQGGTP